MLKDVDDKPREPARRKAERRWRNYDVEQRFKAEKAKPAPKESKDPEIAETIKNEELKKGTLTRAQTKFAKFIREMLEDHKHRTEQRNLILYAISIRARHKRLLMEKLRRLELREAQRVAESQQLQQAAPLIKRDLFS
jgi:hypothetical protein